MSFLDDEEKIINNETSQNAKVELSKEEKKKIISGYICLFATLVGAGTLYVLRRESKVGPIKTSLDGISASYMSYDNGRKTNQDFIDVNGDVKSTEQEETKEIAETNEVTETTEQEVETSDSNYVYLTKEDFEKVVGSFVTKNGKKYSGVSSEDIVKFVAIANIDEIVESNEELSKELFSNPSKEEYLNDAAKVIGTTVMFDYNVWSQTNSTEEFVRISDIIIGSQKDKMIIIEDYVNRIADAVNSNDEELVNSIIAEFIDDMSVGKLSKLDDGVGFASQIYIALISDVIAKDYLNQENFDMLQVLKTAEKYISNIFTVYEGCSLSNTKTRKLQYDYDTNTFYYENC